LGRNPWRRAAFLRARGAPLYGRARAKGSFRSDADRARSHPDAALRACAGADDAVPTRWNIAVGAAQTRARNAEGGRVTSRADAASAGRERVSRALRGGWRGKGVGGSTT